MRTILAALFFIAFAIWYAAETYVGVIPSSQQFAKPILYLSVFGLLLASGWRTYRMRRLDWPMPVFGAIAVVAGQVIWRDFVHPLNDFKLYAASVGSAAVAIAALGVLAAVLTWHEVLVERR